MVDPSFEVVPQTNPPVYRPWKETTRTWGEWRLQKRAAHGGDDVKNQLNWWKVPNENRLGRESLIWKKNDVKPRKINMEPEDTLLEEENHLPSPIIFRFYVNLWGCI